MERVEVLRGPQGTLYGGSSIGGTIRFMPNAPDPSAFAAELNSKISTTEHADSPGYDWNLVVTSYYAGYPRLYAPIERNQHADVLSEELRRASQPSGFIEWVGGAFFRSTHTQFHLEQDAPGINAYTNDVYGLAAPLNFTDVLATGYSSTTFKDFALFGEMTAHLTDRWQVTGGLRVFHDTLRGVSGVPLSYASLTTQYFEDGVATNQRPAGHGSARQ